MNTHVQPYLVRWGKYHKTRDTEWDTGRWKWTWSRSFGDRTLKTYCFFPKVSELFILKKYKKILTTWINFNLIQSFQKLWSFGLKEQNFEGFRVNSELKNKGLRSLMSHNFECWVLVLTCKIFGTLINWSTYYFPKYQT